MAMLPPMRKAPAEHLLLGQLGIPVDQPADTLSEFQIVGHAGEPTQRRRRAAA
jgi:hypothetical protein